MNFKRSIEMYEDFKRFLPGGVSSSVRLLKTLGHPLYISKGEGSRIYDVDGNEFIDFCMGHGAVILGHRHPRIDEAIRKA